MRVKAPLLLLALGLAAATAVRAQAPVDFGRDIQPVLARSCHPCHGPTLQGGNLRLDGRQTALRGGFSGPAILPGNAEHSPVYRRISGLDGRPQMPLSGEKLSPDVVSRIREWIDAGAVWPDEAVAAPPPSVRHWAWIKAERPPLPAIRDEGRVRNPIDRFVLAELERRGLTLLPEAPRTRLIRRVSLDLTGLPPTPEEVRAFVADSSPDAYDRLVERLLASPRYGERWARPWLDLARYADTNGYEKDMRRSLWPWRDWVINALNRDMPFDRFTIEQLAGDLLPEATIDQQVATGFHRNSMINEEGGIDPEEYRVAAVLDRVNTTATVWLGATIGCAQCHDHKFDPFTQEEYYRLFAFFNNTSEEIRTSPGGGRFTLGPNLSLPAPKALASHRRQAEDQIALLERILKMPTEATRVQQKRWETDARASLLPWEVLQADSLTTVSGALSRPLDDCSVIITGVAADRDTYILTASSRIERA